MTEEGNALRVASDAMLRDLAMLGRLEEEKRVLEPEDERTIQLAGQIEELAARLLEHTAEQRKMTIRIHDDPEIAAIEGPIGEMPRTMGAILDAWREAERDLGAATPGSPAAQVAQDRVDQFREEYRRAHEARRRRD